MSKKSVNVVKNSFTSHNRIEITAKCINKHLSVFQLAWHLPLATQKKRPLQRKCMPFANEILQHREKKSNLVVFGAKTYALNSVKKSTNFEKGQRFFYVVFSVKSDFQRNCFCLLQNINFANGTFFLIKCFIWFSISTCVTFNGMKSYIWKCLCVQRHAVKTNVAAVFSFFMVWNLWAYEYTWAWMALSIWISMLFV